MKIFIDEWERVGKGRGEIASGSSYLEAMRTGSGRRESMVIKGSGNITDNKQRIAKLEGRSGETAPRVTG